MKKLLIALLLVPNSCSKPTPTPSAEPTDEPSAPTASVDEEEPPAESDDATERSELTYSWRKGRTRVYLPLTSSICQVDDQASPRYQVAGLWRFDVEADEWVRVDVNSEGGWRISCNAMLDLIDVFGFDLERGTYAIAAGLDGIAEPTTVFTVGPDQCNDVAIEPPAPPGEVAACVVGPNLATARHVPDPSQLEP